MVSKHSLEVLEFGSLDVLNCLIFCPEVHICICIWFLYTTQSMIIANKPKVGISFVIPNTNLKWLFPYLKEIFVFCVNKKMTKPTLYVYLKLVRKDRVYKEDKIFACSLQAVSQREEEK